MYDDDDDDDDEYRALFCRLRLLESRRWAASERTVAHLGRVGRRRRSQNDV